MYQTNKMILLNNCFIYKIYRVVETGVTAVLNDKYEFIKKHFRVTPGFFE